MYLHKSPLANAALSLSSKHQGSREPARTGIGPVNIQNAHPTMCLSHRNRNLKTKPIVNGECGSQLITILRKSAEVTISETAIRNVSILVEMAHLTEKETGKRMAQDFEVRRVRLRSQPGSEKQLGLTGNADP